MRIAVFASGGGTNLQALLDHFNSDIDRGARIKLVISDRASAGALRRAANAGVATAVIPVTRGGSSGAAAHGATANDAAPANATAMAILDALRAEDIGLIALAGYLRLVPAAVIETYRDRVINIHPALLPAFGGAGMYGERVHQAVLDAGCMVTGATVHHVDERYDEGRIIAQWPVPVLPSDDATTLARRVLRTEHALFPLALEAVIRRMTNKPASRTHPADTGAVEADRIVFELRRAEAADVTTVAGLLDS